MSRASATLWMSVMGLSLLGLGCAACATMARFDPVREPPKAYRGPSTVVVEFVSPERVALRCMERGARIPANACATADLITMPNPCEWEGDKYAAMLCHEQAHAQGWE